MSTKEVAYVCANCGQSELVLGMDKPPALCSNCGDDEFQVAGNSNTPPAQRLLKGKSEDEVYFLRSILQTIARHDNGKSGETARNALKTADQLYRKKAS